MPLSSKWYLSVRFMDLILYVYLIARLLATYIVCLSLARQLLYLAKNRYQLLALLRSTFSPHLPVPYSSLTVRDKFQT
jgi:hypothetical protein